MTWVIAALSVIGTILNIQKDRRGFILWALTNAFWLIHNIAIREYAQAALFTMYFCLAVLGLRAWKKGGRP